jgi:pimeloyl-ACP methyl ester carboxylesterase
VQGHFFMTGIFIHGLASSSRGRKAQFFRKHFPDMLVPDFAGDLQARMEQLHGLLADHKELVMVGSSFGGLMATLFGMANGPQVKRLVLLAPALNFSEFIPSRGGIIDIPTWLYIGKEDTVTPLAEVEPLARAIFSRLHCHAVDDDHLLRNTFRTIDWGRHLSEPE